MTASEGHRARMGSDTPRGYGVRGDVRKRETERSRLIPSHLTVLETAGQVDCSICSTGITAPESFGGISRSDMIASFIVQHYVHTKAGKPTGLTAAGKPSRTALAAFEAARP